MAERKHYSYHRKKEMSTTAKLLTLATAGAIGYFVLPEVIAHAGDVFGSHSSPLGTGYPTSGSGETPTSGSGGTGGSTGGSTGGEPSGAYSWLWTDVGGGINAPHPLANPPSGNNVNGAANVQIVPNSNYQIFTQPSISCARFVEILKEHNSPAYRDGVAAEIWYEFYIQGMDPRVGLALFDRESGFGTNRNWVDPNTLSIGNEEYNAHLTSHSPGYRDFVASNGIGYMDFSPYGKKGWVVSAWYIDGWMEWAHNHYGSNDVSVIMPHWSKGEGNLGQNMDALGN